MKGEWRILARGILSLTSRCAGRNSQRLLWCTKLLFTHLARERPWLPLGEAVTKNGSSEPILVTDEGLNSTQ